MVLVGSTHLPFSQNPLLLYNGTLTLHLSSGKTSSLMLDTHSFLKLTEGNRDLPVCYCVPLKGFCLIFNPFVLSMDFK